MAEHAQREDRRRRVTREMAANNERWGGKEESMEMETIDDISDLGTITWPYEDCECLWWGACQMVVNACDEAVSSFDGVYPVTSGWVDVLVEKAPVSALVALDEIDELHKVQKTRDAVKRPKDHFPDWQQAIVKGRVDASVEEAKKLIAAGGRGFW